MIVAKAGDSSQQFCKECPVDYVEMNEQRPSSKYVCSENDDDGTGTWVISTELLVEESQSAMLTELQWCDLMLKYINSGDVVRSKGLTLEDVNTYSIACRNHVQNVEGVLTIVGDTPIKLGRVD